MKISLGIFSKGFKCFAGYVDDSSSGVDYRIAFRDFTCIYSCRKSAISESTGGSLRFIYSGTPILVQLYVVYYGVPALLQMIQIDVSSWNKIIFIYITYGLNTAAFQSETFRAAILSRSHRRKRVLLAVDETQMYRQVILPQVVRVALPAFGTTTIALLQDTSLAFTIGVVDAVGKARAIGSDLPYT